MTSLRLDCTDRYSGMPLLWHDQTKVGNYDQALRIPERSTNFWKHASARP